MNSQAKTHQLHVDPLIVSHQQHQEPMCRMHICHNPSQNLVLSALGTKNWGPSLYAPANWLSHVRRAGVNVSWNAHLVIILVCILDECWDNYTLTTTKQQAGMCLEIAKQHTGNSKILIFTSHAPLNPCRISSDGSPIPRNQSLEFLSYQFLPTTTVLARVGQAASGI
ncbi:hypothetical protein E2C01_035437 [Portunus trituberculatus]|uniref:Uncharacterized protein n=1 Tax=Portunus trituberculatus TaxID=210409 RepID=A0A5B7F471_PORTR|nr:hypothetical protein [Portunus trituberculatus]